MDNSVRALFTQHHEQLVRVARVFVRDQATAEEVVQDVWLAVLHGLPQFEGRSSLKTWMFRILANIAKTRGVRERRWVPSGNPLAANDILDKECDESSPERKLLDREALEVVTRAMEALPPPQHAVVVLRDLEGLEATVVCQLLGVSEANLRVLHHRARVKLRKAMERYAA